MDSKIRNFINDQKGSIQVACSFTNTGLNRVYLTNSGMVSREEYHFDEDVCFDEGDTMDNGEQYATLELNTRSWSSIKRLQNVLAKIY